MDNRPAPLLRPRLTGAMLLVFGSLAVACDAAEPRYPERWVYCMTNLQVDQQVNDLIDLMGRARKAGYSAMVIADYKLQVLYRVPDFYFRNVEKLEKAAARMEIELIPAVFSIGYSNGHLARDPNLAEGLPVVDQPFVVRRVAEGAAAKSEARQFEAVVDTRSSARLSNGDLEQTRGDRFVGFTFQDDPGVTTFADRQVVHGGRVSCRFEPGVKGPKRQSPNVRLMQRVALRPYTGYRLSFWARTRGLGPVGSFQALALGSGRPGRQLTFQEGLIKANQDWKRVDVAFNSLDQKEANLYVGIWDDGPGSLWIDDLQLEELPLVNVLRRPGCPFTVKSADRHVVFEEGRDFEPVADPRLGAEPWAGEYDFGHAGARIRLRPESRIRGGERLLVSWYHPVITVSGQVMCCLSEPKLEQILREQAVRVNQLFRPRTFFMSHDEIRVANWCKACQDRKLTPGRMLADNARKCTAILQSVNPRARIVVWSDMFDPHHNAVASYYLVNGSLAGSWEGLSPDVIIANWNSGKARASLEFFAGRGHRQVIAGYYDAADLSNFRAWDAAARGVKGIAGFMYTTWEHRFEQLEAYGDALR